MKVFVLLTVYSDYDDNSSQIVGIYHKREDAFAKVKERLPKAVDKLDEAWPVEWYIPKSNESFVLEEHEVE
jgi:hypothetical protein